MKHSLLMLGLAASAVQALAEPAAIDGKTVFAKNCAACHQAGGTGIPGAFPALKGDAFVVGDAGPVITTVLKGRAGMPSFAASLDDAQLAAVLSYVRGAWGNAGDTVSAESVAAARSVGKAPASTQDKSTIIH